MRARTLFAFALGYGPALLSVGFALRRYGRSLGYLVALPLSLAVGIGVLGLSGLFLAYFPLGMKRLGFTRFSAFLRSFWDEDAK